MLLLSYSFFSSIVLSRADDVWMPPPAESMEYHTSRQFRRLAKEDFQKTSPNFFDFEPNCEQLGAKYCDYAAHNLGSGNEFASWMERTQSVYVNMARMDFTAFSKAPYNAQYNCGTKSGLVPYYWSSELTQAARFHSHQLATLNQFSHDTPSQNAYLFGNSVGFGARVQKFMTKPYSGLGENIAAGTRTPLGVTKQWLRSSGHCRQIFGSLTFMGVGYAYDSSSKYKHYWTENFWSGRNVPAPTQDIVAGTHDTTTGTSRFLVQVHMSQAPTKVSVVVGGTTKTMALLLGTAKSGTYFVDVDSLWGADSDGCVPYYFETDSSRMPADKSYHFLTYGVNNCKRNVGKGTVSSTTVSSTSSPAPVSSTTDNGAASTSSPAPVSSTTDNGASSTSSPAPVSSTTGNGTPPAADGDVDADGTTSTSPPAVQDSDGVSTVGLLTSVAGLCTALQGFFLQ